MSELNPFAVNRAEFMRDLWKYYVPIKELDLEAPKSLVVEGGRGTGKSTVFLCNSWRNRLSEAENDPAMTLDDYLSKKSIGIYYKVDGAFLSVMEYCDRNDSERIGLFNTYLSVELCKELFSFLDAVSARKTMMSREECERVCLTYNRVVRHNSPKQHHSFAELSADCNYVLNSIEDCINYGTKIDENLIFRITASGSIFKTIIDELMSCDAFSGFTFRVYIDEFESLYEWQQKQVNTLIKQSRSYLIYNICMRQNGFKTYETTSANETIQSTHDYKLFKFENLLETQDYKNTLKLICEKRFKMFFEQMGISSSCPTDIEAYLGNYSAELEIARFDSRKCKFKIALMKKIKEFSKNDAECSFYTQKLCDQVPLLNARLHLALLLRAKKYRPTLEKLYNCYEQWSNGRKSAEKDIYDEWVHSTKNGLIFLLAKDCHLEKWYYGFDIYVMLSSGIARYFLELCEQAFNYALMNDYKWDQPQMLSPEIQTKAAKFVSRHKVEEVSSYPIYGINLRIFIQFLGEIFKDLHRNDRLTLGEPEPNHFTIDSLDLLDRREILKSAITWSVLQELPQTKGKENVKTHIVDYHLNKIYAPYFEISCLKNRKIVFTNRELSTLLSGNKADAEDTAKAYLDKYWRNKSDLPDGDTPQQIALF